MAVSGFGIDPALVQMFQRPRRLVDSPMNVGGAMAGSPAQYMPALGGYGFPLPRPVPQPQVVPPPVMFRGASVPPRPDVGAATVPAVVPPVVPPVTPPVVTPPGNPPPTGSPPAGVGARLNAQGHWIRGNEAEPYPGYAAAFRAATAQAQTDYAAAGTNAGDWMKFLGNWRRQRPGWLQGNYAVVAPPVPPVAPANDDLRAELERLFSGAAGTGAGFSAALRALFSRSSGRPAATPRPVAPPPERES